MGSTRVAKQKRASKQPPGRKCPHCRATFHVSEHLRQVLGHDRDGGLEALVIHCPACDRLIVYLLRGEALLHNDQVLGLAGDTKIVGQVYPTSGLREAPPEEVPERIRADYLESAAVLPASSKAAAALGRRCLQNLLRSNASVRQGDLSDEIQQVLDSKALPSHLSESLDAIRVVGNFAAHPIKSKSTGEIVDVEPGEAEWTLDTLDGLFDFYFVQPALTQRKKDALNSKLKDAGKPALR